MVGVAGPGEAELVLAGAANALRRVVPAEAVGQPDLGKLLAVGRPEPGRQLVGGRGLRDPELHLAGPGPEARARDLGGRRAGVDVVAVGHRVGPLRHDVGGDRGLERLPGVGEAALGDGEHGGLDRAGHADGSHEASHHTLAPIAGPSHFELIISRIANTFRWISPAQTIGKLNIGKRLAICSQQPRRFGSIDDRKLIPEGSRIVPISVNNNGCSPGFHVALVDEIVIRTGDQIRRDALFDRPAGVVLRTYIDGKHVIRKFSRISRLLNIRCGNAIGNRVVRILLAIGRRNPVISATGRRRRKTALTRRLITTKGEFLPKLDCLNSCAVKHAIHFDNVGGIKT